MRTLIDRKSPAEVRPQPWRRLTRIGFRFAVVYFTLYALVTHIAATLFALPGSTPPPAGLGPLWPMSAITSWVAVKILGDASPLVYRGNSRDTNFFWAEAVWVPIAALLAAGLWSVLDQRRENYTTLHDAGSTLSLRRGGYMIFARVERPSFGTDHTFDLIFVGSGINSLVGAAAGSAAPSYACRRSLPH